MHNFKELKVWQKAIDLSVEVYKSMASFPVDERYGLVSQMKRCSVSIPSNIAEGSGRNSDNEFRHFLTISQGSSFELETQLIISNRLEILNDEVTNNLISKVSEVQKMIYSLVQRLGKS